MTKNKPFSITAAPDWLTWFRSLNLPNQSLFVRLAIEEKIERDYGGSVSPPPDASAAWGVRHDYMQNWHQCERCQGWNVGVHEDKKVCADCGWREGDK